MSRDEDQIALYNRWREGDEGAYEPLVESFDPLIQSYANRFKTYPVPMADIRGRAYILTRKALEKYDPSKAKLSTHIMANLAPLQRYVTSRQNPTYLPEQVSGLYGQVSKAKEDFYTQTGRYPNVTELSKATKIDPDTVERVEMGIQPMTLVSSIIDEAENESNVHDAIRTRNMDNLRYLRAELEGKELKAYDAFVLAMNKGNTIKPSEVAAKLGVPVEDIYAWRKKWTLRLKNA
jgi:DNA-directed RNA polymerase specialized sigma subunit